MEKPHVIVIIGLGRGFELGISASNRLVRIDTNTVGGPTLQDLGPADEDNFQALKYALNQLETFKTLT